MDFSGQVLDKTMEDREDSAKRKAENQFRRATSNPVPSIISLLLK
jgi:hypothetical protein